jgi:hypothetical protein
MVPLRVYERLHRDILRGCRLISSQLFLHHTYFGSRKDVFAGARALPKRETCRELERRSRRQGEDMTGNAVKARSGSDLRQRRDSAG